MRVVAFAVSLVGCGRVNFDPLADGGGPGAHDTTPASPWALVQVAGAVSASVPITPSASGDLIVVAVELAATDMVTGVTDDRGNTYAAVAGARATNASPSEAVELWYAADSHAGVTLVTAAAAGSVTVVAWEFSGISKTNPLDVGAALDNGASSTSPIGPSVTTRMAGEAIVSAIITPGQIAGTPAGDEFTNDLLTDDNGWAHLADPSAPAGPHTAHWDANTGGAYCAAAAAFVTGP